MKEMYTFENGQQTLYDVRWDKYPLNFSKEWYE